MKRILIFCMAFAFGISGCDKKDDDTNKPEDSSNPGGSGANGPKGTLALSVEASNSYTKGNALRLTAGDVGKPSSIASGSPETFEITVKKISLVGKTAQGAQAVIEVFSDATGKPIKVNGPNVDISSLFTTYACYALDGTTITPPEGETCKCGVNEDKTVVKAEADGTCPTKFDTAGNIAEVQEPVGILDVSALEYTALKVTFGETAKIKGCVSAEFKSTSVHPGEHTYCTKSALGLNKPGITPAAAEFESATAEATEIYIQKTYPSNGDLELSFPIANGFKVAAGEKSSLTMVIDVNRMLRFYNMGLSSQSPNPGFPTNRAYFFTTLFQESLFVFAGKAGKIQGMQWTSATCGGNQTGSVYTCAANDTYEVHGWVTLIQDADSKPLAVNFMPDDDNNLTTIKGGNNSATGLNATKIVKKSDSLYDISYDLDNNTGTIYDFDISKSVGGTFTSNYKGVYESFGTVTFTKGL